MNINLYSRNYAVFLFFWSLALTTVGLNAQNRSYDGYGNNPDNPTLGTAGAEMRSLIPVGYLDGISMPNGVQRPNPRTISNLLFAQEDEIYDDHKLTDYIWVFGQLIDHDITLVGDNHDEPAFISVPSCDPIFDPACQGGSVIPMSRSVAMEGSGTDVTNPRVYANQITAFIDGSVIYGSDASRAEWLRSRVDGKLKTSEGGFLPFNTITGELNSPTDDRAPKMDVSDPDQRRWFVAGDTRANENVMLTSMHILFLREHNRTCDFLKSKDPGMTDEELYQKARKIVGGILQNIVYKEWLPAMGVTLDAYHGYRNDVNPGISNVFSAAAYRFGHTLISKDLLRMDDGCMTIPAGDMTLRQAFFNTVLITESGIDPVFKGMSTQIQQALDCKVIDDLRNFLFAGPGSGIGMDLAAININRGRERGLPDYNSIRDALGLGRVRTFEEICIDPVEAKILSDLYGTVDNIDPWVGMLAEEHLPGAMFGETIMTIMKDQFKSLRDGDRFFFLIDGGLSVEEKTMISNTGLADLVRRNTTIEALQDNVFYMERHCDQLDIERQHLSMTIAPNPVRSNYDFNIYAFDHGDGTLRIHDMLGRLIQEQTMPITEGLNSFSMYFPDAAPMGVYTLSLQLGNKSNSTKIIKIN